MRLELRDDASSKFWEVDRKGKVLRICWGRVGTSGQVQEKSFATPQAAETERDKLIASKRKKGYVDARGGATKVSGGKRSATRVASAALANPRCIHVGHVSYNAHPASPLVIGDFDVMKGWEGDPDGGKRGKVKIATGTVINVDLQLVAPDVFQVGNDVVLLAEEDHNKSLLQRYELDELKAELVRSASTSYGSWRLEIPSAAVVVSIAYNATPEAGADTSHLDPIVFRRGEQPVLPKKRPSKPLWTDEPSKRALAVIPVTAGTYAIQNSETERFFRCTIRRVGD